MHTPGYLTQNPLPLTGDAPGATCTHPDYNWPAVRTIQHPERSFKTRRGSYSVPLIETNKAKQMGGRRTCPHVLKENSREKPNEMEISNSPDKEVKKYSKILNKLENAIEKLRSLQQ